MVPIANYLVLSAMLFLIGVMGVLFRRRKSIRTLQERYL